MTDAEGVNVVVAVTDGSLHTHVKGKTGSHSYAPGQGVCETLSVSEAERVVEGDVVGVRLRPVVGEGLGLTVGESAVAEALGDGVGVPKHTHRPLAVEPQATKQHSCGQTVIVTLGEMVGVAVVGRLAETETDGEGEAETVGDRVADTEADTEGTVGEGELLAVWLAVDDAEMQTQTMFGKVPVQL